jgi:hypothetical protein
VFTAHRPATTSFRTSAHTGITAVSPAFRAACRVCLGPPPLLLKIGDVKAAAAMQSDVSLAARFPAPTARRVLTGRRCAAARHSIEHRQAATASWRALDIARRCSRDPRTGTACAVGLVLWRLSSEHLCPHRCVYYHGVVQLVPAAWGRASLQHVADQNEPRSPQI